MELMEINCFSYPSAAIFLHRQAFVGILVESSDSLSDDEENRWYQEGVEITWALKI